MRPTSIYIHIPFCNHICAYCDFIKMQYYKDYANQYIFRLIEELDKIKNFNIDTIYIGGGTPSSLDAYQLNMLLTYLDRFTTNIKEFTIEINPENIDEEKMKIFARHKINRLSIGVQTFNESNLLFLGRKHRKEDVLFAIDIANKYGINNISLDLIYGLPHQTQMQFITDVKYALNLNIQHLSLYSLTIEDNTSLKVKKIKSAKDDLLRRMSDRATNLLKKHGFSKYEVSNYAKEEQYFSKHNLVYWRNQQYYGIGAGASGYIGKYRYTNTKSITKYLRGFNKKQKTCITHYDLEYEYIMLNLRTCYGIIFTDYYHKFKVRFEEKYEVAIAILLNKNLISMDKDHLAVKDNNYIILNSIILKFIDELEKNKEVKEYAKS